MTAMLVHDNYTEPEMASSATRAESFVEIKDKNVIETYQTSVSDAPSTSNSNYDWDNMLDEDTVSEDMLETRKGWKYKFAKVIWDSADKGPKERAFLFKLDLFFLSSIMFGYFIKTLNQNNINTAYINGMQQYLNMKGSDLNYLQSLWTAGYIIGQVPSNLVLHRISARYYLGILELVWCALTFLTVTCNTFPKMCALRFFVGLTESGFFPGVEYLLGSWYSSEELTKRATLFAVSGTAAGMVTGYFQAAIINGLQNTGITPFKWLFILDGVVSFPVALYTMIANPNTPETTTSWYLTKSDRQIALLRRKRFGARPKKSYTLQSVKDLFSTWHVYVFPLIFLAYNNSSNASSQPSFQTWLKELGYDSVDFNVYPTAVNGAGIGFAIIFAWVADWYGGINYPFIILFFLCEILGCAFLAVWNIPIGLHWFAYFLVGSSMAWGQPMIFSWVNQLFKLDNEKRNLLVVVTNNIAYITNAFIPIFTFRASAMPEYFVGFTYTACLSAFGLILTFLAMFLVARDKRAASRSITNSP